MPRRIFATLVLIFLSYTFLLFFLISQAAAAPEKPHILYGNVYASGERLLPTTKPSDAQFSIFMQIEELGNQIISSFKMGSMGDQYGLIVPMSIRRREPGSSQQGDTAHIYIDIDDDPENGNEIPIIEAYLEPGHQPAQLPYIIGEPGAYVMLDIHVAPLKLVAASYDILNTTLILEFNRPVLHDDILFDGIGMEVGDSGNWDIILSDIRDLRANETEPSNVITIDINRDHPATVSLAVAGVVSHQNVDLLLQAEAFVDQSEGKLPGSKSEPVTGADNVNIEIIANGLVIGTVGDVSGNGEVTAYDAALILQSTINGQTVFPTYRAALDVSELLASYTHAQGIDVMMGMADVDNSGDISAYDAALVLRRAVGFADSPSRLQPTNRETRAILNVNNYDGQRLDVSIDLGSVDDVYSADIVMTYNSQALALVDVSGTSSVSKWLLNHGTKKEEGIGSSAPLRISLAGASQPTAGGPLVNVSFDVCGLDDPSLWNAIRQLNIAEFKLNGGMLKATTQNLPRTFVLLQNYPNPFNPETWIPYQLSEAADVTITIYNVNGLIMRRLELGKKMPGYYIDQARAAHWDGTNELGEEVSSGIYFYQLRTGRDTSVRKMIILK